MKKVDKATYRRFAIMTAIVGFLILYWFFNPLNLFFPKCPVYVFTGMYCTGCGSQRALHAFLHGNIADACRQNFLAVVCYIAFFTEIILSVLQKTNWKPSALLRRRYAALYVLVAVMVFTIARNIPVYPFTVLAPFL